MKFDKGENASNIRGIYESSAFSTRVLKVALVGSMFTHDRAAMSVFHP
jgi:hypothetical protein